MAPRKSRKQRHENMASASRHLRNQHLVWLGELSRKYKRPVNLATAPPEEWDQIASGGFDAVWLMGVWERSPAGIDISMQNQGLLEDFMRALPN
jgi:hypothetical protein